MRGVHELHFLHPCAVDSLSKASVSSSFARDGISPTPLRMRIPILQRRRIFRPSSLQKVFSSALSSSENSIKETVEVVGERPGRVYPAQKFSSMILAPCLPPSLKRLSQMAAADQAFLLLGFIAFMISGAFFALLATAIPTLNAMRRAALALERLADAAREELPGTMAAVRLSGMEISDLTLELSDLSQDICEGVRSSARAVQAAEVGIRRIGSFAASQTFSMLQERASMPVEAVKPVVATAAETTRQAVTQAQRAVLGLAALPVLSKWIQKKNIEEQKKIQEDMEESVGISLEDEAISEL